MMCRCCDCDPAIAHTFVQDSALLRRVISVAGCCAVFEFEASFSEGVSFEGYFKFGTVTV